MKKFTPILVSLGILAAIVFVVVNVSNPKNDSTPSTDAPATKLTADQQAQLKVGQQKGDTASKVTVTEFGDFQCPACGNVEKTLQASVYPKYGGKINFVFKHLPLIKIHKNALSSAYWAEAASEQGKFWEMHDKLYEKQDEWSELGDPQAKYDVYATDLGLDLVKLKADAKSTTVKGRVSRDSKLADMLKLPGTPSFFVNGKLLDLNSVSDLTNAIDKALAQ